MKCCNECANATLARSYRTIQEILVSCRFLALIDFRRRARWYAREIRGRRASCTRSSLDDASLLALGRRRDSLFFSLCCRNRRAVQSIRDCAASKSPVSSWLGGQNGEEVKVEDEVRREENGAQDREAEEFTQEEGVTPHRAKRLRHEDCVAFSRRGCHAGRRRTAATSPAQVDGGGVGEIEARFSQVRSQPAARSVSCAQTAASKPRAAAVKRRGDPAKDGTAQAVRCRHGVDLR